MCCRGEIRKNTNKLSSRKHAYILITLNPTSIVKLGFTEGYSLEPLRRGGSNKYHNLCFEQKYEKYQFFLSENFQFFGGEIFYIFQ